MTPDVGFMKNLKTMDRRLDCAWNPRINRFVITFERAHKGSVPILVIQSEDKKMRYPDQRDLDFLAEGDIERVSVKERCERTATYFERYREKKAKEAHDNIRGMTKDDKIQLMQRYSRMAGVGKGNSAFRRITPKKKGKSANELENCWNHG